MKLKIIMPDGKVIEGELSVVFNLSSVESSQIQPQSQPEPEPQPQPEPQPPQPQPPQPQPEPIFPYGTKENPVLLNKPVLKFLNSFSVSENATFSVSKKTKIYFAVDPVGFTSKHCESFTMNIKTFNNANMRFYKSIKEKSSGNYIVNDERIYQNYTLGDTVSGANIDNYVFLYAVENTGISQNYGDDIELWWAFNK